MLGCDCGITSRNPTQTPCKEDCIGARLSSAFCPLHFWDEGDPEKELCAVVETPQS